MAKVRKLASPDCLGTAEEVIREGGILVYPTDTLYGLGVDPRNRSALERLSRIKGRQGPWSIAVAGFEMLETYGEIPPDKREFVSSHLPGRVTVILKARKSDLSPAVLGPRLTVGIRIPGHPFPVRLTERLRFPITTTSVNRTGKIPLNDPAAILNQFGDEVDLIVDGGRLPPSAGSRIYNLSGKDITVVRNPS